MNVIVICEEGAEDVAPIIQNHSQLYLKKRKPSCHRQEECWVPVLPQKWHSSVTDLLICDTRWVITEMGSLSTTKAMGKEMTKVIMCWDHLWLRLRLSPWELAAVGRKICLYTSHLRLASWWLAISEHRLDNLCPLASRKPERDCSLSLIPSQALRTQNWDRWRNLSDFIGDSQQICLSRHWSCENSPVCETSLNNRITRPMFMF